ncbi:hypothetical protein, partial [Mesorhizobium sp.]|uniref:hypothetical protein n=1 Tax=Mesorhizobium sp. TaxID=1871066 RepID=UPI00257FB2DD
MDASANVEGLRSATEICHRRELLTFAADRLDLSNYCVEELDQLERGGQDDHCSQPDCGEAGNRQGSTGRPHGGCFGILEPAHRNACGLFQPVDVGNRQSHFSRTAQQTAIETSCGVVPEKNTIEPYGEQMVKAGAAGINPHPS